LSESSLTIIGLDWQCSSIDDFAAVRQAKKITDLARDFRAALFNAGDGNDIAKRLRGLMRDAMEWGEVAQKVKRGFEVAGYVASAISAVPGIGIGVTLAGYGLAGGQKEAEKREQRDRWYLIGPKMGEVALEALLKKS
jgi:hypothetical protein